MPKGWPQDQTDLRRPYSDEDSTSPGQAGDGRADSVRRGGWDFGPNHPSGPLPIGPVRDSRRGRSSRRSREGDWPTALDMGPGDEDYDWIRYLGEAGPAQDTRPSAGQTRSGRQRGQDSEPERRLPRRHARPDPSGPAAGSDETASWPSDPGPQRPARHRHSAPPNPALPDPGRVVPAPIDALHLAPERGRAPRRPQGDFPPAPTGPGARGSHRRAAPPQKAPIPVRVAAGGRQQAPRAILAGRLDRLSEFGRAHRRLRKRVAGRRVPGRRGPTTRGSANDAPAMRGRPLLAPGWPLPNPWHLPRRPLSPRSNLVPPGAPRYSR